MVANQRVDCNHSDNNGQIRIADLLFQTGRSPQTRGKDKGKYECPACGAQKLTVHADGRKFNCWECGDTKQIFKILLQETGLYRSNINIKKFVQIAKTDNKKVLTLQEWHNGIANLKKYLGLSENARASLKQRGLSDEAIAANGYFSLPAKRVEVSGLVHKDFPGTVWGKDEYGFTQQYIQGIYVGGQRYETLAIPRLTPYGLYCGLQYRALGDVSKSDRYRVPYAKNSASGNRVIINDNSEPGITYITPLAFERENQMPGYLFDTEGYLKPGVFSDRFGVTAVGASAAQHTSSPQQFYEAILYAIAIEGMHTYVMAMDKGVFPDEINPDGNINIIFTQVEKYIWIQMKFPGLVNVMATVASDGDPDEVDRLPKMVPFWEWLAIAAAKSKKVYKELRRCKRENRDYLGVLQPLLKTVNKVYRDLIDKKAQAIWKEKERKKTAIVIYSEQKDWEAKAKGYPHSPVIPDGVYFDPEDPESTNISGLRKRGYDPIVYYEEEQASAVINAGLQFGLTHPVNISEPGTGKSYEAGNIKVSNLDLTSDSEAIMTGYHDHNKAWYITNSPMNFTSATVEANYEIMPSRAEILYAGSKQTPLGRDFYHTQPGKDRVAIPGSGNCGDAACFPELQQRGYEIDQIVSVKCSTCRAFRQCQQGVGRIPAEEMPLSTKDFPYGFLFERKGTIASEEYISCHQTQLPSRNINNYQRGVSPFADIVILDDVKPITTKENEVSSVGIDRTLAQLATYEFTISETGISSEIKRCRALRKILEPLLIKVKKILEDPEVRKLTHGMTREDMMRRLNQSHRDRDIGRATYFKLIELFTNITGDIWEERLSDDEIRVNLTRVFSNIGPMREALKEAPTSEAALEIVKTYAIPQWVTGLLMAIMGKSASFSVLPSKGGHPCILKIVASDRSIVQRMNAAIVYTLDGTTDADTVARDLGVRRERTYTIRQKPLDHSNLQVMQVKGFGKMTAMKRSKDINKRVRAAIKRECDRGEVVAVIDHKRHVSTGVYDDLLPKERIGWWGAHNRATNAFKNCTVLFQIGDPNPNMGATVTQLEARTGERVEFSGHNQGLFWHTQRKQTRAEIIQCVGRLRSGRSDVPKKVYKIGGDMNLDYLSEAYPGMQLVTIEARELLVDCAVKQETYLPRIVEAVKNLYHQGLQPKLAAIAEIVGLSQQTIRRTICNIGNWKTFQTSLINILEGCNSWQSLSQLPNNLKELAKIIIPERLQQWKEDRDRLMAQLENGEHWKEKQLTEIAYQLAIKSMIVIEPLLKLPVRTLKQFLASLDSQSETVFWELVLSLVPVNPDRTAIEMLGDRGPPAPS